MIAAIPTMYAGIRFRSRLEAKWAAMFDQLGWSWEYEPLDLAGYIPDFLISGPRPLLVEVKPITDAAAFAEHERKIDESGAECDVLIVGALPIFYFDDFVPPTSGWLGEQVGPGQYLMGEPGLAWGPSVWMRCLACNHPGMCHADYSWEARPCGHHDGDHYLGPLQVREIRAMWARATNVTQWRPS